ncbi:MAG: hypothetical protein JWO44_906 [Bacteroidetes bacterium]|nr:hypothetical protein [Bacteroidota bacterium]
MRKLLLFFFILASALLHAQSISIDQLRKAYYKLNTDSTACAELYAKINKTNSTDNLINGYKGAVSASMANHVKSRQEKIKLFNSGKKLLEQAIATDSANVELRFLRFTIQTNCPKALGYYRQAGTDKKYIIAHLGSLKNTSFKNKIIEYMLSSANLSAEEKKQLHAGTKK